MNVVQPAMLLDAVQSLGDHFKRCRLKRKLSQIEAARRVGVSPDTVLNWEKGHTKPPVEAMPAVLRFLGYDPLPEPKTLPERLLAKRRAMGWSIRETAKKLGVDPGTWRDWERGRVILHRNHRALITQLLGLPDGKVHQDMEAHWIRSHKRPLSPEAGSSEKSKQLDG